MVSDAEFEEFEKQKADALSFLVFHRKALSRMREVPGVEHASIDFGIAMRNVIAQFDSFEPELLNAIVPLRLTITLSQYPVSAFKRLRQYRRVLRKAI